MKTSKKIFLCCSFVLLALLATQARAVSATTELGSLLKDISTIQGKFVQTVYDQNNKPIALSNGIFMLQRPNRFRWQENAPLKQLTVANGKHIWFYQPDLQQVSVVSMLKGHNQQIPLAILSGSTIALSKKYAISEPDGNHFILLSKAKNAQFSRIELTFINNKIQQMKLFDNLGQKTIVKLKQLKLNHEIATNKFHFTIPKNVDVIYR